MSAEAPVLAVTGLLAEARIAAAPGVVTIAGGGDGLRLAQKIEAALVQGARRVISFGIAGGLEPGQKAGTLIIARAVSDGTARFDADPRWVQRLSSLLPEALVANLMGVDRAVTSVERKSALHLAEGAAAVDMESHIAARLAARHGVAFAAVRIIADPADRTLPLAATAGMRLDGSTDVLAVLKALGRNPAELPGLIRTALDARAAFASLAKSRRRLGPLLGFDGTPGAASQAFSTTSASDVELPAKSA